MNGNKFILKAIVLLIYIWIISLAQSADSGKWQWEAKRSGLFKTYREHSGYIFPDKDAARDDFMKWLSKQKDQKWGENS